MTTDQTIASSVDATTAALRSELPLLEARERSLADELAAVTERLSAVRTALEALGKLSPAPQPVEPGLPTAQLPLQREETEVNASSADAVTAPAGEPAEPDTDGTSSPAAGDVPETPAPHAPIRAKRTTRKTSAPEPKAADKPATKSRPSKNTKPEKTTKATPGKRATKTPAEAGNLTDQVLQALTSSKDDLRAREVTLLIGREDTPGAINTVRSTLDRLVGTSRARRAGRGLYSAARDSS
ncbi:hypothetical protein ACIQVO_38845 [Streptomyces sp. NPDC101062]|uniref:hypothetical protein n=1 Tax=unclassified Streptomyces TaxID=2593676 RepID=UPI0037F2D3EE